MICWVFEPKNLHRFLAEALIHLRHYLGAGPPNEETMR
jgi:hypothetical protein